jgi:hypothetical protein
MLPELYKKYKHLEDLKIFWGGKSKKITNVREYLEKYFKNGTKGSYYKDGTIQCYPQRNRSFYDLFFIVKARFKEITEEELAFHVIDLFNSNKLRMVSCGDVMKVTFFIHTMHLYGYSINDKESNWFIEDSNRKYGNELSFNEIKEFSENYEQQQIINN